MCIRERYESGGRGGRGIAGLTAAFDLMRRGIPVTLYEKSGRTGGAIRSVLEQGFLAENGPTQITETPEVAALVEDLGLAARRLYPNPTARARFIIKDGQPVEAPASPFALISTKLFSGSAKLRVLAEPFIAREMRRVRNRWPNSCACGWVRKCSTTRWTR